MNPSFVVSALKSNWYLVVALVAVLIVGLILAIRPEGAGPEGGEGGSGPPTTVATGPAVPATPSAAFKPASKEDQARIDIKHYMEKLVEDPKGEEAPRNLHRMANLYFSSLRDYGQAAYYYEELLHQHPDDPLNDNVFANLALCYERLNDSEKLRWTYERMLERFPKGTAHYQFAQEKLTGKYD